MVKSAKLRKMSVSEFRAKCLALMDEVAKTGVPIVITRRGVPVGQIEATTAEERQLFHDGKLGEWKRLKEKRPRAKGGQKR